jgi:hypothetical protein
MVNVLNIVAKTNLQANMNNCHLLLFLVGGKVML